MQICTKDKCTGCYACIATCPHKCISMIEDKYGEYHPCVDEQNCTQCGACIKVCPNNKPLEFHYPEKCFASWITDKRKRRICASGGIGTILSEYMINHLGGVVFGSRYDDDFTPIMSFTEKKEDLEKFKGSRYVQSIVGENTFQQVRRFLKDNRNVLFIGTPCQIAGLKSYLRTDYDNLTTVDLICHGCTPTKYFKEELSKICSDKKLSAISDVRFRGNDGFNYCFSLWRKNSHSHHSEDAKCIYKKRGYTSYYLAGFMLGVTLRENCYSCQYARPERVSDITIGDFIGLGKELYFPYPKQNVSSVLINTERGKKFYQSVTESNSELMSIERPFLERLKYRPSLMEPSVRHPLNNEFRRLYVERGYFCASREVLYNEVNESEKALRNIKIRKIVFLPYWVIRKVYRYFSKKQ